MKNTPQLHELKCFGLIDRDFRGEHEINSLKADGIFTIRVAEVENLFLVEELLEVVNAILARPDRLGIDNIKKHVIEDRFPNAIERQILEATIAEAKYKLSKIEIPKGDELAAQQKLADLQNEVDYDNIKIELSRKYRDALVNKDYKQLLSIFNSKGLVASIGHYLGLRNQEYCDFVIHQLNANNAEYIIAAVAPYLPNEISL